MKWPASVWQVGGWALGAAYIAIALLVLVALVASGRPASADPVAAEAALIRRVPFPQDGVICYVRPVGGSISCVPALAEAP